VSKIEVQTLIFKKKTINKVNDESIVKDVILKFMFVCMYNDWNENQPKMVALDVR
jgi:hypothetical protein